MRITTKGQVTVPKELRDRHGFTEGSDLDFVEEDGKVILVKKEIKQSESDGAVFVRQLKELGAKARREGWASGLTADEIMEMTRGTGDGLKSG
jgi:antitoxin PrlF